jgi:hypothetical protein
VLPIWWNSDRVFEIRGELHARFFQPCCIAQDEVDCILGILPIVRCNREKRLDYYHPKLLFL